MQIKQRLDALTSLRFVAALMIVWHHSIAFELFGLGEGFSQDVQNQAALNNGVSFFFVLSGFILAYVYPKLETWVEVKRFLWARIARIWPALVASFVLAFWLLSLSWDYKTGLANLLMVNAWIPYFSYAFSYNSPSWSISTEFFFYFAFPLLILKWEKTWPLKLLFSGIVLVLIMSISHWLALPEYGPNNNEIVTVHGLLYIHPISRIFEFIFGMLIVHLWRQRLMRNQWGKSRATLYEIGAILFAVASVCFISSISKWLYATWKIAELSVWLSGSGSMLAFGLLIYVMAMERGRISAWLAHPTLVLLGEISFAVYLIHQILLRYYKEHIAEFPHLPDVLSFTIFWIILLLASYLMWALIEMPGRRWMLSWGGQKKIHATKVMEQTWRHHLNWNRNTLIAFVALVALLGSIFFSMGSIHHIDAVEAGNLTPVELKSFEGSEFGGLFKLRGLNVFRSDEGVYVELAWESLVTQKLEYTNGLRINNDSNDTVAWADYKQPMTRLAVKAGTIWKDSTFIANEKFTGEGVKVLLGLYQLPSFNMLTVKNPLMIDTQWLNIPIEH